MGAHQCMGTRKFCGALRLRAEMKARVSGVLGHCNTPLYIKKNTVYLLSFDNAKFNFKELSDVIFFNPGCE